MSVAIPDAPSLAGEPPSLRLESELLYQRLKALGPKGDLLAPFQGYVQALEEGFVDGESIWLSTVAFTDAEVQNKVELVMKEFADRRLMGLPGIDESYGSSGLGQVERLPPSAKRDSRMVPGALCNTCPTPVAMPAPTAACQFVAGNTTSACPSDFYSVTLTAGTNVVFTMCTSTCTGATAGYDTRIKVRDAVACTLLVENDDSTCGGLLSEVVFTAPTTGTYVVEVTGFTPANFGTYNMGYKTLPPCASCVAPRFTTVPDPDATCRTHAATYDSCRDFYYQFNLTAGLTYQFSTCPNLPAGCGGTASFDTVIEAYSPACALDFVNDDASGCSLTFRSFLEFTPAVSGPWRIRVRAFSSTLVTGNYTLAYRSFCAADADADGHCDDVDNCPSVANPSQADADTDDQGDECDPCPFDPLDDVDADGFCGDVDNCPTVANPSQADADADGIGDDCDACTDTDGDGFGDPGYSASTCPLDNCPSSDFSPTVVVDGCDTGVPNVMVDGGCTIADLVQACASAAGNHGEFVSCVAKLVHDLKSQGLILKTQVGDVMRCAGKGGIP